MSIAFHQRGIAGVVFLAIFAMILIGVLTMGSSSRSVQSDFDAKTFPVLAAAKEALIAYAVANAMAPGRLPCVDIDNDGLGDSPPPPPGNHDNCTTPGVPQLGRLPWKTLGLPIPRDGSGECLWYAVSGNFAQTTTLTEPINSDNGVGQFTIKQDATTTIATNVIAVVFAPGQPLEGNDRTPAGPPSQCGGNNDAAKYLDAVGGNSNATAGGTTFYAASPSETFNDRLVYITRGDLLPRVERRVAGQIGRLLANYYKSNGYYPFASTFSDPTNCTSNNRGGLVPRFPASCGGADWPSTDPIPAWFTSDKWNLLTYYAVATPCTVPVDATNCNGGAGLLTLSNGKPPIGKKQALVIEAGQMLGTQTRPASSVADLLDAPQNTDNNDTYITLPRSSTINDTVIEVVPVP
jgi:hypothetical protein